MGRNRALPSKPDNSARLAPASVLDAAAALFRQKGYAGTTTREIASAAGIQQASLYYHVSGKEVLLYQICLSALEELLHTVETGIAPIDCPLERIRTLMRLHLTTVLRSRKRNVTMLSELHALSAKHRNQVMDLRHRYADLVESVLAAAQDAKSLRGDIPPEYLYLGLLNVLNWAVLWFREGGNVTAEQVADVFARLYLEGAAQCPAVIPFDAPNFEQRLRAKGKRAPAGTSDGSNRVLNAAVSLFSQKGYAGTSTREIATLIGIRKASLYYHIGSKEELLFQICKSSLEQIRADVAAAIPSHAAPLEQTRALVRSHIESMLRDQPEHLTALLEMRALSPEPFAQVMALRDSYEHMVESVLREAQACHALRTDIDGKLLRLYLLSLLNRTVIWHRPARHLPPDELGEVWASIFLSGTVPHTP